MLREALREAKRQWVETKDYGEVRDAFRSIRQDCVLQGAARRISLAETTAGLGSKATDRGAGERKSGTKAGGRAEKRGKGKANKRAGQESHGAAWGGPGSNSIMFGKTPPSPPPSPSDVAFHLSVLEVAADAYGAHARLTLEAGDWRELRRCVEPLLATLGNLADYARTWERQEKTEAVQQETAHAHGKTKRRRVGEGEQTAGRNEGTASRAISGVPSSSTTSSIDADSSSNLPRPSYSAAHSVGLALEFAAYDLAVAAASGTDAWYDADRRAERFVAANGATGLRSSDVSSPTSPAAPDGLATLLAARRACRAFFARETVLFARLHAHAPRMLPYALDPLAAVLREASYAAVTAAYRPALDGKALARALGFPKRRQALAFARERGGFVEDGQLVLSKAR